MVVRRRRREGGAAVVRAQKVSGRSQAVGALRTFRFQRHGRADGGPVGNATKDLWRERVGVRWRSEGGCRQIVAARQYTTAGARRAVQGFSSIKWVMWVGATTGDRISRGRRRTIAKQTTTQQQRTRTISMYSYHE